MATKLKPGTPRDPRDRVPHYTQEQFDAIPSLGDPGWTPRFARKEFVNAVLAPDGSIIKDGAKLVLKAVKDRLQATLASKPTKENLIVAADLTAKLDEVEEHIKQGFFLFIVDETYYPRTYFQCAVPGNPELKAVGVSKVKEVKP